MLEHIEIRASLTALRSQFNTFSVMSVPNYRLSDMSVYRLSVLSEPNCCLLVLLGEVKKELEGDINLEDPLDCALDVVLNLS